MKRLSFVLFVVFPLFVFPRIGLADSSKMSRELKQMYQQIQQLRQKIEQLEQKLQQREVREKQVKKQIEEVKEAKETIEEIKKRIGNISLHGGVVSYYQAASSADVDTGGWQHFANPDGAGYVADIELEFEPIKDASVYIRIHAGEGNGADEGLEEAGALFADLNTINDDNPDDSEIDVLEICYTQSLFNDMLSVSFGKTEPFVFVDDNEFANDENSQFVGKPFVNNPMFDSEDEYAPIVALQFNPRFFRPLKNVTFTALVQSSSWGRNEGAEINGVSIRDIRTKDEWSNLFRRPLIAGQITYSPQIKGLQGNYRLYGWVQTYRHLKIGKKGLLSLTQNQINQILARREPDGTVTRDTIERITGRDITDEGWGIGLSCDQYITERIGVFGRFGYQNDDVYEAPIFYSIGSVLKGIIPFRKEDQLGIGFAGLKANNALLQEHNTEYHVEGYYRFNFSDHFAMTCDLQWVGNPRGNSQNDNLWVGMVRGEFEF